MGYSFRPIQVTLLRMSKDPCRPGADPLPGSLPNGLQGPGLARAGLTCFSVPWLQACTRSHADLRERASWREQTHCVTAQRHRVAVSQLAFSAWASAAVTSQPASPGGSASSGLPASHGRDGGFGACVRAGRDRKFELCFGPTVQQRQALHYRRAVALETWSLP